MRYSKASVLRPSAELIKERGWGGSETNVTPYYVQVTPLHHDPHHNLLAQVVGRKYVRLYPPPSQLYPCDGMNSNSSQVGTHTSRTSPCPAGAASRLLTLSCLLVL